MATAFVATPWLAVLNRMHVYLSGSVFILAMHYCENRIYALKTLFEYPAHDTI